MINLATFVWLVIGASIELPPWEQSFQDTRSTLESFEKSENPELKAAMAGILRVHIGRTEDWTRTTINEYRRSDFAHGPLMICNIVGLAILAFKRASRNSKAKQSSEQDAP